MRSLLARLNPVRALRLRRHLAEVERAEAELLRHPQISAPITDHFAPGVYLREMSAPAGAFIIGHEHRTEHFNILLAGRLRVYIDGTVSDLTAPAIIRSGPGTRKGALVLEDVRWITVHATDETDPAALEALLIKKSKTYLEHEARKALENHTPSP